MCVYYCNRYSSGISFSHTYFQFIALITLPITYHLDAHVILLNLDRPHRMPISQIFGFGFSFTISQFMDLQSISYATHPLKSRTTTPLYYFCRQQDKILRNLIAIYHDENFISSLFHFFFPSFPKVRLPLIGNSFLYFYPISHKLCQLC